MVEQRVVASIHNKLDHIANELQELHSDFRQKHELDDQCWESIYTTIQAFSSLEPSGTTIGTSTGPLPPHPIPPTGKMGKRHPLNDLNPAELKRLRFASNSPNRETSSAAV
jgi:hypothetical protein